MTDIYLNQNKQSSINEHSTNEIVADDELTRHYLDTMNHNKSNSPMTTKEWISVMGLSIITGGIINLFWAGSKTVSEEKRNWSRATLIVLSAVLAIYMVGLIIVTFVLLAVLDSYNGSIGF